MSFFQRLVSYWMNQVMVDGLANSRWFQRFAIRTDKLMQEGAAEYQQKAQEFTKVFREEMKKGMEDVTHEIHKMNKPGGGGGTGGGGAA
eukprot:PRCOL_00001270-RA